MEREAPLALRSPSDFPSLLQPPQAYGLPPQPLAQLSFSLTVESPERLATLSPRFHPALSQRLHPEKLVDVFSENTTLVGMLVLFFAKCYFFHIRGLISCNSWRVRGGRRARKPGTEGSSD